MYIYVSFYTTSLCHIAPHVAFSSCLKVPTGSGAPVRGRHPALWCVWHCPGTLSSTAEGLPSLCYQSGLPGADLPAAPVSTLTLCVVFVFNLYAQCHWSEEGRFIWEPFCTRAASLVSTHGTTEGCIFFLVQTGESSLPWNPGPSGRGPHMPASPSYIIPHPAFSKDHTSQNAGGGRQLGNNSINSHN